MNRAERRAQAKANRAYSNYDAACKRYQAEAKRVAYHEINLMWAGTFVAMHRRFGWGKKRLTRLYNEIKDIMLNSMSGDELRRLCKAETGLDVEKIVSSEEDVEEELRRSNFDSVEVERWEM